MRLEKALLHGCKKNALHFQCKRIYHFKNYVFACVLAFGFSMHVVGFPAQHSSFFSFTPGLHSFVLAATLFICDILRKIICLFIRLLSASYTIFFFIDSIHFATRFTTVCLRCFLCFSRCTRTIECKLFLADVIFFSHSSHPLSCFVFCMHFSWCITFLFSLCWFGYFCITIFFSWSFGKLFHCSNVFASATQRCGFWAHTKFTRLPMGLCGAKKSGQIKKLLQPNCLWKCKIKFHA